MVEFRKVPKDFSIAQPACVDLEFLYFNKLLSLVVDSTLTGYKKKFIQITLSNSLSHLDLVLLES